MFVDESDDIASILRAIESFDFVKDKDEFREKIFLFLEKYKKALEFREVEELEKSYIDILKLLHKYKEYDIFKRKVIKPFLKLATVKVDKDLVIIPAFHPLRIISFYYKIKKLNNFINNYFQECGLIKEDLFFEDLIYDFTSIHYPEIFKDEQILKVSEAIDEYSLFENVKKETLSKTEEINIFTNVVKEYLNLNKHKKNINEFQFL